MIKGAVSDLVHFVNNANCASLLATEREKIACQRQNHSSLLSKYICLPGTYISNVTNNKNEICISCIIYTFF